MKRRVGVLARVSREWILIGQMAKTKRRAVNKSPNPWGICPAGEPLGFETSRQAACRELNEEIDKEIPEERFLELGSVEFQNLLLDLFVVEFGQNEQPTIIRHNEEYLQTRWCHSSELPWEEMLPEHPKWLPDMLAAADAKLIDPRTEPIRLKIKKPAA